MNLLGFEAFRPFSKIPRLHGDVIVTEKLDGTNACVEFEQAAGGWYAMAACSRNRRLVEIYWHADQDLNPSVKWQGNDNYGFGAWVVENRLALRALGYGRHFGEWWGKGIQRTYGLDERRFSLFHANPLKALPSCVGVVPELAKLTTFSTAELEAQLMLLRLGGSVAAPGFMDPEGLVAFHARSGQLFKLTFAAGPKGTTDESGHQLPEVT